MELCTINNKSLMIQRDAILQESLRPTPLPFAIASEYPIVLSETGSSFSYGLTDGDTLICHANLWPRQVVTRDNQIKGTVGLIGNVATTTKFRGRGLMQHLLTCLEQEAQQKNIDGLVLWSDLSSFYQKLGFRSLSAENRYFFNISDQWPSFDLDYLIIDPKTLAGRDFTALLKLRPLIPLTLRRSLDEFAELLSIPASIVQVGIDRHGVIQSYLICGKGYDMCGVVHEWGGAVQYVHQGLFNLAHQLDLPQIMLLCPEALGPKSKEFFNKAAHKVETHPMALYKPLSALPLEKLFIWGLDSI